jgi:hypothetical protein
MDTFSIVNKLIMYLILGMVGFMSIFVIINLLHSKERVPLKAGLFRNGTLVLIPFSFMIFLLPAFDQLDVFL